jgi:hypothetical protein
MNEQESLLAQYHFSSVKKSTLSSWSWKLHCIDLIHYRIKTGSLILMTIQLLQNLPTHYHVPVDIAFAYYVPTLYNNLT